MCGLYKPNRFDIINRQNLQILNGLQWFFYHLLKIGFDLVFKLCRFKLIYEQRNRVAIEFSLCVPVKDYEAKVCLFELIFVFK